MYNRKERICTRDGLRLCTFRRQFPRRTYPMNPAGVALLMYRFRKNGPQVLLLHPGGPVWKNKDDGVWSLPKRDVEPGQHSLATAEAEFERELGIRPLSQQPAELKPVKQKSGKIVHGWAVQGDCDTTNIRSNQVQMEWPPGSGRQVEFPEFDRAMFFDLAVAKRKANPGQAGLLDELQAILKK
jgi:predicted NUDIX family NTP pyrophosphohydrolase